MPRVPLEFRELDRQQRRFVDQLLSTKQSEKEKKCVRPIPYRTNCSENKKYFKDPENNN